MIAIALAARAGGGKTTAANILVQDYGFKRIAFAAPLYDMLQAGGFGRPVTQAEKEAIIPGLGFSWRHAAQTLGTEWGRVHLGESIWTDLALRKCSDPDGRYVFDDLRFENEGSAVREAGGYVVHMIGRAMPTGNDEHASEKGIVMRPEDLMLDNSGSLMHLYESIGGIVSRLEVEGHG